MRRWRAGSGTGTRWRPPVLVAFAILALSGLLAAAGALAQGSPVAPPAPASPEAADRKARLDGLFAALAAAGSDAEAEAVVAGIWEAWLQSGREDVDLLMQQAAAGMASRNYGVASLLLDEVVALAPGFAEGWNRRATLRFLMGDHAGSLADIEKVLALEPRHFGALAGRAMIHIAAERWQAALDAYRAALAVNPFLAERHRVLPALQRRIGDGRL